MGNEMTNPQVNYVITRAEHKKYSFLLTKAAIPQCDVVHPVSEISTYFHLIGIPIRFHRSFSDNKCYLLIGNKMKFSRRENIQLSYDFLARELLFEMNTNKRLLFKIFDLYV